jgi:hypothetical protein
MDLFNRFSCELFFCKHSWSFSMPVVCTVLSSNGMLLMLLLLLLPLFAAAAAAAL